MGIDDIVNKGKDLFEQNRDKVEDALKSEQAEQISDNVLNAVSDAARKVVPQEHHGKIDEVRDNIDRKIGNE